MCVAGVKKSVTAYYTQRNAHIKIKKTKAQTTVRCRQHGENEQGNTICFQCNIWNWILFMVVLFYVFFFILCSFFVMFDACPAEGCVWHWDRVNKWNANILLLLLLLIFPDDDDDFLSLRLSTLSVTLFTFSLFKIQFKRFPSPRKFPTNAILFPCALLFHLCHFARGKLPK